MSNGPRLVPPGNWHYKERSSGEPIRADGFVELIDALTKDRVSNGVPVGDPEGDIRNYVITNWPHYASCVSRVYPEPPQAQELSNRQTDRVSAWLANRYSQRASGETALVDETTANARAEICASCPQNQTYAQDCAPCVEEISRKSFILRQGASPKMKLHSCAITGQENTSAVFLPQGKMLAYADKFKDQLPAYCWLLS